MLFHLHGFRCNNYAVQAWLTLVKMSATTKTIPTCLKRSSLLRIPSKLSDSAIWHDRLLNNTSPVPNPQGHDEDSFANASSPQMANFANTAPFCVLFYMVGFCKDSANQFHTKRQPCCCIYPHPRLFVDCQAQNTPLEHNSLHLG